MNVSAVWAKILPLIKSQAAPYVLAVAVGGGWLYSHDKAERAKGAWAVESHQADSVLRVQTDSSKRWAQLYREAVAQAAVTAKAAEQAKREAAATKITLRLITNRLDSSRQALDSVVAALPATHSDTVLTFLVRTYEAKADSQGKACAVAVQAGEKAVSSCELHATSLTAQIVDLTGRVHADSISLKASKQETSIARAEVPSGLRVIGGRIMAVGLIALAWFHKSL